MGKDVSAISAANQTQAKENKPKVSTKLTEEQLAKLELPKALAKKDDKKAGNKPEQKVVVIPKELKKEAGLSTGQKVLATGAILGAVAGAVSMVKPSWGKALKGAFKLATKPAIANAAQKGMSGKQGLMAVGGLIGTSIVGGCREDFLEEEHNHFVPLPTDTVVDEKFVEVYIDRPVYITKTDTIYHTDTIGIPEIVERTDTIWQTDTIKVPEYIEKTDTVWKTDTIKVPEYIEKTDTVWKTDTIQVPEYIEKTDTVWQTDTVKVPEYIHTTDTIYKTDTIKVPEYITETDTIWKTDTITVPEYIEKTDTIYKTDTIKVPEYITETDTIWKTDTVKVPEYITETDTIWQTDTVKVPEYIEKTDTVWKTDTVTVQEIIEKTDTIYETVTDTVYEEKEIYIEVPGETIFVKEDFESEVPEKMKEMLHDLGIDTTGVGKFVYGVDYQDAKNNVVHRSMWDGGRTSRDGSVYVMNDIGTKWSNPDEAYVFGKNEEFTRRDFYLNSDEQLVNDVNVPLRPIEVTNNTGSPNWFIFQPGQSTAEPGNWKRSQTQTFTKIGEGRWESSDGFIYERGDKPNSIKKINKHGSEWLLKDISIIGGNDAKDPKKK